MPTEAEARAPEEHRSHAAELSATPTDPDGHAPASSDDAADERSPGDATRPTGSEEAPAARPAVPFVPSAYEREAEAMREAEERARQAAREFADRAAAARMAAAAAEAAAAEGEATALRFADAAFPSLAASSRLLETLQTAQDGGSLFGPGSGTSLGREAQLQACRPRADKPSPPDASRDPIPFAARTLAPPPPHQPQQQHHHHQQQPQQQHHHQQQQPQQPQQQQPPPPQHHQPQHFQHQPPPSSWSIRPASGRPAVFRTQPLGAAAAWRRDDWGAAKAAPAGGSKPPPLAVVQAQQAGEEEARAKLEHLVALGFGVDAAAAALLRCGGDVKAAAAALRARPVGEARGEARGEAHGCSTQPPPHGSQAWRPSPNLQLMKPAHPPKHSPPPLRPPAAAPSPAPAAAPSWAPKIMCPPPRAAPPHHDSPSTTHSPSLPPSSPPSLPPALPPRPPPAAQPRLLTRGSAASPSAAASLPARPAKPAPPAGGLSMGEKLNLIKAEMGLPLTTPMAATVKQANERMAIAGEGALPAQVDRLLAALNLPRPSTLHDPPPPPSRQPHAAAPPMPPPAGQRPGSMVVVVEPGKPLADALASARRNSG